MNNKFIWTLALLLAASSMSAFAVGVDKLQPLDDASRSSSYQNAVKSDIQKAKAKQGAVETSQSGGSVDLIVLILKQFITRMLQLKVLQLNTKWVIIQVVCKNAILC